VVGLADALRSDGHLVFGPSAAASQLEGDKAFAKSFMVEAGIPTAAAVRFDRAEDALAHLESHDGPCVVKATGLAAGKGVSVCDDAAAARAAVREMMEQRSFGSAGDSVLIEERLVGRELSVFAVVDGERACWFAASRDHKRLDEGDQGPNTGGMGAYTPVGDASPELMREVEERVLLPTLRELGRRDLSYRGLLYLGLMLTDQGPSVLEYNCRFGDPETQVVLPTFDGDLYALLAGAAEGRLPVEGALATCGAAVGVVLAAEGYPVAPTKGAVIGGLDEVEGDALVFHAGVRRSDDGVWTTAGGRVLCVVGTADDLARARERALAAARRIRFEGAQWRSDIGHSELG
jgi:phosphoribosylamine--glycine ligase